MRLAVSIAVVSCIIGLVVAVSGAQPTVAQSPHAVQATAIHSLHHVFPR